MNDSSAGKNFALNLAGDRMSVFHSSFFGKDDMFYTGGKRIFVAHSVLNGSTDFLFGQGAAVFLNCTILAEPGKFWSFVTAANGNCTGSGTAGTSSGCGERSRFLLDRCRLPAQPGGRLGTTFLGRPWGEQSSVLYKNCWMDKHINPAGWALYRGQKGAADGSSCMNTSYEEFNSSGPGAAPEVLAKRVKWSRQLSAAEAAQWTARSVLGGWTPPPEPALQPLAAGAARTLKCLGVSAPPAAPHQRSISVVRFPFFSIDFVSINPRPRSLLVLIFPLAFGSIWVDELADLGGAGPRSRR